MEQLDRYVPLNIPKSIEIKISSHYDNKYTIIKIYDNGMGISEKDQEPFSTKFETMLPATKRTKLVGAIRIWIRFCQL